MNKPAPDSAPAGNAAHASSAKAEQREKQLAEAEELLADRVDRAGFAKGLYFGQARHDKRPRYPNLEHDEAVNRLVAEVGKFCRESIDPAAIDRNAEIPRSVVEGLGKLGVLGACLPREHGGSGLSQVAYCRVLEVLGGHCGST